MRPKILITNDDGINAEGIKALEKIVGNLGTVYVVAPSQERSAAAHSISFNHPLRVNFIDKHHVAVDGTPTDCTMFGFYGLLKGIKPSLLISGINHGVNLGDDITYSGTVSAALEGTLLGIPSISFSMQQGKKFNFFLASNFIRKLCKLVIKEGLSKDTFLNVNIPGGPKIQGIEIVRQGKRIYRDRMLKKNDPRGKAYYWLSGSAPDYVREKGTDFAAIYNKKIAITPLKFDFTNYEALEQIKSWKLF